MVGQKGNAYIQQTRTLAAICGPSRVCVHARFGLSLYAFDPSCRQKVRAINKKSAPQNRDTQKERRLRMNAYV